LKAYGPTYLGNNRIKINLTIMDIKIEKCY